MATVTEAGGVDLPPASFSNRQLGRRQQRRQLRRHWASSLARRSEAVVLPVAALLAGFLLFALFLTFQGKSPIEYYSLVYKAGFGSAFSWQNTLVRAAPLLLAALCVALPARLGLVVIGGEGAIVISGVMCAYVANLTLQASGFAGMTLSISLMFILGTAAGAIWIGAIGVLRHWRGVNETISSLLMTYIAIALMNHLVEGPLRDPASLNKPSTIPLSDWQRVGMIPGTDVHWGLLVSLTVCIAAWLLFNRTTWGFGVRIAGSNVRAAQIQGLPVGRMTIIVTCLAGACAGLAGAFEVAAIHGAANASLVSGIGYSGILVAFLARQHALAIIPVAIMLAGFEASSGLIQRRMDLPDVTVLVLQGVVFITILTSESLYGRFRIFSPERWKPVPDLHDDSIGTVAKPEVKPA